METNEFWSPYDVDDFTFDILAVYIRHGFRKMKMYEQNYISIPTDEVALMTIEEYWNKVQDYRGDFEAVD